VILRCVLDGLLLKANITPDTGTLVVYDGDESFVMEAIEARFYEVVRASEDDLLTLERAGFRLLRRADDFACCLNCC
jgi:hypothetical protein